MALFPGEELVTVRTPDGRTLQLPRSVVPSSAQVVSAPPPVSDELAGAAPGGGEVVPSVTEDYVRSEENPGDQPGYGFKGAEYGTTPVQNGADFVVPAPKGLPTDMAGVRQSNAKYDQGVKKEKVAKAKADKAAAAYAASPQGQLAAVQGKQDAAQSAEQGAVLNAADVEAAEQATVANAMHDRNETLDRMYGDRNTEMQDAARQEEAKLNEVVSMRQKIADTKINRDLDHPVMTAIFAALAGLGSAMKGEKVDTLDLIYKVLDRKVAAQMADLDQMAKVYDMSKDELGMLKDKSKNKLEMYNTMISGETLKAVRMIEEITARSASAKTKANAQVLIAQLQQRAADKTLEATRWGLDYDQKDRHHKESVAAQNYATSVQKYGIDTNAQLRREELWADLQKALAADRAKGDEATMKMRLEADKEVRQLGMKDARNDYMLTPEGRAKMAQAAELEKQAASMYNNTGEDPKTFSAKQEALRNKAAILRGDARSFNVVMARDPSQAGEMSKKYAAAQTMMDTIDEINILYDKAGRGYLSKSQLQQELQAKVGLLSVAAKDAWQLGAWDKGSAKLVSDIIGSDPTEGWDVGNISKKMGFLIGKDPEGFKSRLDAVTVKLDQDVRQQIAKNSNWDGKGDLFTHKTEPDLTTPNQEAVTSIKKGTSAMERDKETDQARAAAKRIVPGQEDAIDAALADRATTGSVKYQGLNEDQGKDFDHLVTRYKSGDRDAGDKLVAMVAGEAAKRPDLALPLLRNLQQYAPSLYDAARRSVPKGSDVDKQMLYEESKRTGVGMTETNVLATNVLATQRPDGTIGDQDGFKELSRRAGQGDKEAQKAVMQITTQNGARKGGR